MNVGSHSAAVRGTVGAIVLSAFVLAARDAQASPDELGPMTVTTWDPGMISLAGTSIHVHGYYPAGATGPMPIVAVIHGASEDAAKMAVMSNTFASRGFVALAPDMPCGFTGCDHQANALQIRAMLDWGVAQSAGSSSPIAGLVDGSRRGVAGHSWGGLAVFLAAEGDSDIGAVVILDANDDSGVGQAAAPHVTQPNVHIMADKMGACNDTSWKTVVYPITVPPHMRVVVTGAAHCDVEDPIDPACPVACGSGDPSLATYFRRYAVAWMSCILQRDTSMTSWLGGGSDLNADVSGGHLQMVDFAGLDALPCFNTAPDSDAVNDAEPIEETGATDAKSVIDAGELDASIDSPAEAADQSPVKASSGCGCSLHAAKGIDAGIAVAAAIAIAAARRRRRSLASPNTERSGALGNAGTRH